MGKSSTFLTVGVVAFMALFVPIANAQQGGATSDEQKLVEKIKEAVMKELRESDFLSQQIELGIQNYIKKQQQAQMAARAEGERQANEKAMKVRRVSASRDHVYGDPNAPVSLIEYSDFECPFCKRFHATANEIVDAYGGKVNWVYRHFPLSMQIRARKKRPRLPNVRPNSVGTTRFGNSPMRFTRALNPTGMGFLLISSCP